MGKRSGGKPAADQPFFQRILHALDMTPLDLAREIAVHPSMVVGYKNIFIDWAKLKPTQLPDMDREALWTPISNLLAERTAHVMAAKSELDALLAKQQAARLLRLQTLKTRDTVSPPKSINRRTPQSE